MRAIPQRQPLFLGGSIGGVPSFDLNFARGDNAVTKYGFSFTRATAATYVDSTGNIATAASGELRYTYDPVTLSALGVLIEEARTNLSTASTDIVVGSQVSVSGSQSSPDGGTNGVLVTESTANSNHYANQTAVVSFTSGTTYTLAVFIKPGTATRIQLTGPAAVFGASQYANFGLTDTGAVLASSGVTATIQKFSGGWYRCSIAVAATASTTGSPLFAFINADAATRLPSYTGTSLTVTGFGWQIEAGAFPTSYIPTTGTTATRNADVLSLTGAAGRTNLIVGSAAPITQNVTVTATPYTLSQTGSGTITLSGASTAGPLVGAGSLTFTPSAGTLTLTMSGSPANVQLETGSTATTYIPTTNGPRTVENVASWFNGDAGTWVAQVARSIAPSGQTGGTAPRAMTIYDAAATNYALVSLAASGSGRGLGATPAGTQWDITPSAAYAEDGTAYRIAMAYAEKDVQMCAKGVLGTADTSAVLPAGLQYVALSGIGSRYLNGTISRIRYYPRRLPDATLQRLTA